MLLGRAPGSYGNESPIALCTVDLAVALSPLLELVMNKSTAKQLQLTVILQNPNGGICNGALT